MKRAAVLAATICLLAAAPASGHETAYPTTVQLDDGSTIGAGELRSGHLESSKTRCISDRTIKLYQQLSGPDGPFRGDLLDTGRSSTNGAWALIYPTEWGGNWEARATKKNIGKRGHKHICEPGSYIAS